MRFVPVAPGRVLAIDPCGPGFGFAVFEEPERLLDWGVKNCARARRHHGVSRRTRYREAVERLLKRHDPSSIALRWDDDVSRRDTLLHTWIEELALDRSIPLIVVSAADVRGAFAVAGATTKVAVAELLAKRYPALLPLPRHRAPWMSEVYRTAIYDAVAVALFARIRRDGMPVIRAP